MMTPTSTGNALAEARRRLTRLAYGRALAWYPIQAVIWLCEVQQNEIADLRKRVEDLESASGLSKPD